MHIRLLVLVSFLFVSSSKCSQIIRDPDIDLSLDELVRKYGFDGIETYEITTSDGYILETFRIKRKDADKLEPVLLVHPLSGCGDSFFARKNSSPPIFLANHNYDVWVFNARGTQRSQRHVKYNVNDKEFWNFSTQEHGTIDLPATIDFVLEKNIHKKLFLIGHSAGSAVIFMTLAEVPRYNEKVSLAFHWGVSIYHEKCVSLFILSELCKLEPLLGNVLNALKIYALYPDHTARNIMTELCLAGISRDFCKSASDVFLQGTRLWDDVPDWSFFFDKAFCGGSVKEILHFMQIGNSGRFAKYNYGRDGNMKIYNSTEPPLFNLKNVISPQVLWCGETDSYCSKNDFNRAVAELPNVVSTDFTAKSFFTHFDFMLARDLDKYVLGDVLKLMKKYSSQ